MSGFLGAAMPTMSIMADMSPLVERNRVRRETRMRPCWKRTDYACMHYPGNGDFYGDHGVDVGILKSNLWARFYPVGGIASRVGFVGVTRDQYGTPTGGCVVQLFRTSDDLFIMEITSDSNGNFLLQSWYTPDTHYIVAYKAGSPDIFGTTVNTLVGA